MVPTVLVTRIEFYEPPAALVMPCTRPTILSLDLGEAMALNYGRYKASDETCSSLHQSLIDWLENARKAHAEPSVVK